MSGVCRFSRATQLRVLREGFEAFQTKGYEALCPYGSDERNGVWSQGKKAAQRKVSFNRATIEFERQEDRR